MNWINELLELYNKREVQPQGVTDANAGAVFLPVSHITASAQIEITIDDDGNFLGAEAVDKEDRQTIIPVTEKSANRTSTPAAHPLCDTLKYIAGDYGQWIAGKKDNSVNFKLYKKQLSNWCNSPFAHPKAKAVLKYINKSCVVSDLVNAEVLKINEDNVVTDKIKIQDIAQTDAFVRFCVRDIFTIDGGEEAVWKDKSLQKSFIDYCDSVMEKEGLCLLTGKICKTAELHPKYIRTGGDQAKLISANDEKNFTYRGRFTKKEQAFSVGYEASQKVHNALKWIIRKQGYTRDGICIVIWESNLRPVVSAFDDIADVIEKINPSNDRPEKTDDESETSINTNYYGAEQFNKALAGYQSKLDMLSRTVIMSLDSATPGRLAITYFKDFQSSKYFSNIKYWHESGSWMHEKYNNGKWFRFNGMPCPRDIALFLYGSERNKKMTIKPKILTMLLNILLPCVAERKRIPVNMVQKAVYRASEPLSYETYNWKRILSIACSLVKKERLERNKEEWSMSFDENCTDRNYLYGALLAVAEKIEKDTFEKGEERETNAMRLMNTFYRKPFRTWEFIEQRIQPYLKKLPYNSQIFYSKLLDEIEDKFTKESYESNERLNGLYLLGYHSQSKKLYEKTSDKKTEAKA